MPPCSIASAAPLELLHQLRVRREPLGRAQELLVQLAQLVRGDGGHDLACGPGGDAPLVRGPAARAEGLLQRFVRRLQLRQHVGLELVRLLLRDDALLDERARVQLANCRVGRDRRSEERLRVGGLVLLVVPVAPVADEVDDDVVAEAASVREREPHRGDRRLGIVGVHVDDRNVEALREVAGVTGRAAVLRIGGEARPGCSRSGASVPPVV